MPNLMDSVSGPIFKSDSDSAQPTYRGGNTAADKTAYLLAMERYRESAREEAFNTARLNPEIDAAANYMKALEGRGWWGKDYAPFRSKFFDNRLNNSRKNDLALLTDARPTISVNTNISAYKQQAEINRLIIEGAWTRQNIDLELVGVVDMCKLNGTAYWKTGAASPGIFGVTSSGPDQVLPIQPDRMDIQKSTAVMYRNWQSLNYLRQKFPYAAAGLEFEAETVDQGSGSGSKFGRPGNLPETTWDRLSPQMRRAVGVQTSASEFTTPSMFQMLEKQEFWIEDTSINQSRETVLIRNPHVALRQHNHWYWVKPGERLYPRKRLVVFAGRRLVYDGPSPFWHGKFPFACLRLDPIPWLPFGLSKYRDLLPLNTALNQIGAGVMDILTIILNPTAVTKMQSVAQEAWAQFYPGMPRAKLMMMPNAAVTDLRYMDNPQLPQQVLLFHQYLSQEFDRLSGAIDIHSLGKKKQVPGGDTIEQMREMQNTTTRLEGRYIEKFLEDAGRLISSDIFQYFELSTVMRLLGEQGVVWDQFNDIGTNLVPDNGLPKEDHWKSYSLKVSQGSLLSNAKDREKQIAISLATHGLISIQRLHTILEIPDGDVKQLLQEKEAGLGSAGKSSRTGRGQRNGKAA